MIWFLIAQVIDVAAAGGHIAVARQDGVTLDGTAVKTRISQIAGVALGANGSLVVFGGKPGKRGEIELVGKWLKSDPEDMVNAVAMAGDRLAVASHDKRVTIRNADGEVLHTLEGHTAAVLAVAFSPDGKSLATTGEDRTIRLWEVATGKLTRTIVNHGDRVGALAWSPDGKFLASGSRDRTMRVWQPEIGRLVRIVRKHEGEIVDLVWTEDALVSACSDGKARLMDPQGDAILKEFDGGDWLGSIAVTGTEVLAGGTDLKRWAR